ncbi:MAG: ABC transporter permease [Methanopyri archaeon]|nr:ABC transporter permease [Methanopyri archaeon]
MDILGIALRNLTRRRLRTALLILGIAVSCASVITMVSITSSMEKKVNRELETFGANIVVVPTSRTLDLRFGDLDVGGLSVGERDIDAAEFANIWKIQDSGSLAHVAPKVYGAVTWSNGGEGAVTLAGIDMEQEPQVKRWWQVDGRYPASENEVLLGADVAAASGVAIGDTVELDGSPFVIIGVLQPTGSVDDAMVYIELSTAQTMLGKEGRYSMVDIRAWCHLCPVEEMVRQIMEAVPGVRATPVKQVAMAEMAVLDSVRRFSTYISAIIILLSMLGLGGLILSSVSERTRELGILMALGFKELQVARLVITENVLIGVIGGTSGFVLGAALTAVIGPAVAGDAIVSTGVRYLPVSIGLALAVTLVSSLYPAHRASRLHPAEALRSL